MSGKRQSLFIEWLCDMTGRIQRLLKRRIGNYGTSAA
eukprot:COSAG03_NODE_4036_length_1711_cov_1.685484_5_plen_36_part_01